MFDSGRRWLRRRRARRLRRRARSLRPADADEDLVAELSSLAKREDRAAFLAVEGLAGLARSGQDHPLRESATDTLLSVLEEGGEDLQGVAARSLRYVALQREPVVSRLDEPLAAILDQWDHVAHREVSVDAGMLLAREEPQEDLPAVRDVLLSTLRGGPRPAREDVALAYVIAAGQPERIERPDEVAEHLAILDDGEQLFDPDASVSTLADGRTLQDAVDAFAAVSADWER